MSPAQSKSGCSSHLGHACVGPTGRGGRGAAVASGIGAGAAVSAAPTSSAYIPDKDTVDIEMHIVAAGPELLADRAEVNLALPQRRRMVPRPAYRLGINPVKTKLGQPANETSITNRMVFHLSDRSGRKQRILLAIRALNKAPRPDPSANRPGNAKLTLAKSFITQPRRRRHADDANRALARKTARSPQTISHHRRTRSGDV
jgi:hypothetical protein